MLNNPLLDQFQFPPEAVQDLQMQNLQQIPIGSGASRFMSGHDKGVAYRFFTKPLYNEVASKLAHYEKFDEVEMIEWLTDKFNHPTEQVRFLPEDLLHVDNLTGEIRGTYAEAYRRYKEGKAAPGTPLEKWGVFNDGEIATLSMNGIFSVEQYAALPRDRVAGKFPQAFVDAWERAAQFVNGKQNRMAADKQAEEMLELSRENAKLKAEFEALKAAFAAQGAPIATKSKKRCGRPKKNVSPKLDDDLVIDPETLKEE
jgi:hypothetical protein